tara:strand:+ start:71 stop:268 length:198 start_codon:yes stop_codon:yes gene_type:complete
MIELITNNIKETINIITEKTEEIINDMEDNTRTCIDFTDDFFYGFFRCICKQIYDLHTTLSGADF